MRNPKSILVALMMVLPCSLSAAQATRVPGSSVVLEPPSGFTASSRFSGFESAEQQASIMVTEVPGPFSGITAGLNARGLASRGMTLISSARRQVDGRQALLIQAAQTANGVEFLKWMLAAGDATQTTMIVATFPRASEAQLSDAMRAAVLSVRWAAGAAPDPFEGLPYRVSPTRSLKVAGRMNNLLVLSESGNLKPQGPNAAMFIVGSSVSPVRIDDLAAFAETRAKQTKQMRDIVVSRQGPISVGGTNAHELVAEGIDTSSGRRVTLYQVLLPENGGYVLMQGLVASTRAAAVIPEFREAAASFQRVAR
jgi:hypothetical protein